MKNTFVTLLVLSCIVFSVQGGCYCDTASSCSCKVNLSFPFSTTAIINILDNISHLNVLTLFIYNL